jgi:eukaryotic-like serine/threonine-protein kinase
VLLLAVALSACRHRPPLVFPALFPITTAWTASVPAAIEAPLAMDDRRVFVAGRDGSVRAFDRPDGSLVWTITGQPGRLAAAPGSLIVRQADGKVTSLEPGSGAARWSVETGVAGPLAPVIDKEIVFVAGDGLVALDLASGGVLWSAEKGPTVSSLPVVAGTRLVAGEADGVLRCRERGTGASLWTFHTKRAVVAPVAVDDQQRLYVGTADRRLLSLDLEKGRKRWQWRVGADATEAPGLAGHLVLFAPFDATLYGIERGSGKISWRPGLPSRPASRPLVVGNAALVVCHDDEIVGFNLKDGRRIGGMKVPAEVRTPPLLDQGTIYLGLRDRTLIALTLAGVAAAAPTP